MPCPFYGKSAHEFLRILVPSGGNQCALITNRYAPCKLEIAGDPAPELERCELAGSRQAIEFAKFDNSGTAPGVTNYPD
jgi:hypothetical protein